ncbi:glutathione S-transferase family protein [Rugamonas sp.]|uniref:glutathione S-transferase family protein n=1 Tax=Rugamonas sp. TaxID=1926287 RepID=UPI0025D27BEF|nr:glutathione S-transferase family protein [Rugamonas sp.]
MHTMPVYQNPYHEFDGAAPAGLKLHLLGIANPEVAKLVPTLSPFSAKLKAYLRFQGIAHQDVAENGLAGAPRVKVPFLSADGVRLADSALIIDHLKALYPDPDAHLTAQQRAIGLMVQRALEDHLYWIILYYEFFDPAGTAWFFEQQFGAMAGSLQGLRDDFVNRTYLQGISRYSPQEVIEKANRDLDAVAEILGAHRYLLGTDEPTSFDAAVFGMTVIMFQLSPMHPEITAHARSLPNLRTYMANLLTNFFPELTLAFDVGTGREIV